MSVKHTKEIWKDVVVWIKGKKISYEGLYKISNYGKIKRIKTIIRSITQRRRNGKKGVQRIVREIGTVKIGMCHDYPCVSLLTQNGSEGFYIHQLVLWAFKGECPEGMQCCHRDDDPTNNHIDNLYWGTVSQNRKDAWKNGRMKNRNYKGENHPKSKFSNKEVKQIREIWADQNGCYGLQSELGRQFKVTPQTINSIVHNKTWKDV